MGSTTCHACGSAPVADRSALARALQPLLTAATQGRHEAFARALAAAWASQYQARRAATEPSLRVPPMTALANAADCVLYDVLQSDGCLPQGNAAPSGSKATPKRPSLRRWQRRAVVHALIELGANAQGNDRSQALASNESSDERTPLQVAIDHRQRHVLDVLIVHGANVQTVARHGTTVLHALADARTPAYDDLDQHMRAGEDTEPNPDADAYAAQICGLVAMGARVDAVDALHRTPLEVALLNMRPVEAVALIACGADPTTAIAPHAWNVLHLLAATAADANYIVPSQSGSTARRKNRSLATHFKTALDCGVRGDIADAQGRTPMMLLASAADQLVANRDTQPEAITSIDMRLEQIVDAACILLQTLPSAHDNDSAGLALGIASRIHVLSTRRRLIANVFLAFSSQSPADTPPAPSSAPAAIKEFPSSSSSSSASSIAKSSRHRRQGVHRQFSSLSSSSSTATLYYGSDEDESCWSNVSSVTMENAEGDTARKRRKAWRKLVGRRRKSTLGNESALRYAHDGW